MPAKENHYEFLNIPRDITCDRIPKVRAALSRIYHPDSNVVHDEERLKRINDACDILEDPERRRKYDKELEQEEERVTAAGQGAPAQQPFYAAPRPPADSSRNPPGTSGTARPYSSGWQPLRSRASYSHPPPIRQPEASMSPLKVRLRALLWPVGGIVASIGGLLLIVSSLHGGSPNFGVAMLGFCCTIVFWGSVVLALKIIHNLFRR